jgi:DNA-directed RNA polymerase specialized sigma24 family protein
MSKPLKDHICEERLFSSIFRTHSKNLHDFLYYKFGSQLNPQDKMQEAFVKLWENCAKIPQNKAKSFLFTTANNLMLNEYAPEFILEEKEYKVKLERAIAGLTEAQRVAFLMNRVEGKRFKEIAQLLDISTKAVEKRIYGALKKLRQDIDEL